MAVTTVAPKAPSVPATPQGQASQIIAWPPTMSGTTGSAYPRSRSRLITS